MYTGFSGGALEPVGVEPLLRPAALAQERLVEKLAPGELAWLGA